MSNWVLSSSKDRDSTTSLGNLSLFLTTLTIQNVFLCSDWFSHIYIYICILFQFKPIASYPVTGHHQEESGSNFFTPLISYLYAWLWSLWALSTLNSPSSKPFFVWKVIHSLDYIFSPALDLLHKVHIFLVTGELRTEPITPDVSHQVWEKGKDHLPHPAGNALPNAVQEFVDDCCKDALLVHVHLLAHQDPQTAALKKWFPAGQFAACTGSQGYMSWDEGLWISSSRTSWGFSLHNFSSFFQIPLHNYLMYQ